MHEVTLALSFAWESAGSSIAARMAMMAITTSSSINVNAFDCFIKGLCLWGLYGHFDRHGLIVVHQVHDFLRLECAVGDAKFVNFTTETVAARSIGAQAASQPHGVSHGRGVLRAKLFRNLGAGG